MRLEDLIAQFRADVVDVAEPPFWSSEQITAWLNEAVQEACERAQLIEDRHTDSVCRVVMAPDQDTYELHCSLLSIKRLTLAGKVLTETSVEELDRTMPGWEARKGVPRFYIYEAPQGLMRPKLRLVPTPGIAADVRMTVYRGALKPLIADLDSSEPEVPRHLHLRLLEWVKFRAYMVPDADSFDPGRARTHEALFGAAFGQRPDANVARKIHDRRPPLIRSSW